MLARVVPEHAVRILARPEQVPSKHGIALGVCVWYLVVYNYPSVPPLLFL